LTPLLELRNISVRRGGRAVLRDVSLAVAAGEFLAVVGPNGAGKSTLLLAALGLLPASGAVSLEGRPLAALGARERAQRMAYVPQGDGRPIPFTVAEVVRLGRYPYWDGFRAPGTADAAVCAEALALTDTAALAERPVAALSGGERQRVQIAAALAQEPRLLLLDEPTAFLDPRHQAETARLLRRLHRERGLALIMVTHDLNLAASCAGRVLAVRDGTVSFLGPPAALMRKDVLEPMYDAVFDFAETPAGPRAFPRPLAG
jgi:cobalamin transport system ATP-binding protein